MGSHLRVSGPWDLELNVSCFGHSGGYRSKCVGLAKAAGLRSYGA